jgi:hypothetical protein
MYIKLLFYKCFVYVKIASVVQWSEFLATDPEVPSSIHGASRFSDKQRVWNWVHSAL